MELHHNPYSVLVMALQGPLAYVQPTTLYEVRTVMVGCFVRGAPHHYGNIDKPGYACTDDLIPAPTKHLRSEIIGHHSAFLRIRVAVRGCAGRVR